MDIDLPPDLRAIVQKLLTTGRYPDADAVVHAALHLLDERDEIDARLRQQIEEGLASAREGPLLDGDEVFDRLLARVDAKRRRS